MTDFNRFAKLHPGAEEGTLLALVLFSDLLRLLRKKGVLTADDTTRLLETAASQLGSSPNALAQRGSRFIQNAMLPVE